MSSKQKNKVLYSKLITMIIIPLAVYVLYVLAVFSGLFSFITNNFIQSVSSSVIFISLGKIISIVKFLPNKIRAIAQQCDFIAILFKESFIPGGYMGGINILSINLDLSILCTVLITNKL